MQPNLSSNQNVSIFKRRTLVLSNSYYKQDHNKPAEEQQPRRVLPEFTVLRQEQASNVLVVNSSQEMAKEIGLQLSLQIPGCSIIYAPTVEVAKWLIGKRKIDLIVSSQILPDGSIKKLEEELIRTQSQADLIVVSKCDSAEISENDQDLKYFCSAIKRIQTVTDSASNIAEQNQLPIIRRHRGVDNIKALGADIRNDLNNPLQEIVAMVFVARCKESANAASVCALDAIERAAKNMATVVKGLEEKIRAAL